MIYVGGPQRTSTGYLWGIVANLLRANLEFKSISELLADGKEILPFEVDGECMDIVQPYINSGFNVLTIQYFKDLKSRKFLDYKNNSLDLEYIASNCSVFQTHVPLHVYKNQEINRYISHYFFIHRNPLDEATSIIKAQSISREKYEKVIASDKLDFQIRRYDYNNINYGIDSEDLQKAFSYLRSSFFNEIRGNILYFLKHKNDANVYEFRFEDLTINNKLEEIKRIANILSLDVDCERIYFKLEESLNNGAYWNNKGKKTNTAKDFLSEDVFRRFKLLFDDLSVLLGYNELADMSSFISDREVFTVVCIAMSNAEIQHIINIFDAFKKDITIKSILQLEDIKIIKDKNYIFCTQNLIEYRKIEKIIDDNCLIYPYYKALFGFEDIVFSLNDKKDVLLDKNLLENSKVILDQDNFSDQVLLQKCKEFSSLSTKDSEPNKNENIILLSNNQKFIRDFSLKYIDNCNIFTVLPMYNFDKQTLCEIFGNRIDD